MSEMNRILESFESLSEPESAVLATVVALEGSSFRLPGAKMLILKDGTSVGTVSGGCLEADVLKRSEQVRTSRKTIVSVYDTRDESDSVFSLDMGCRGVVSILMQPAMDNPALKFYRDNLANSRAGVVATLISGNQVGAQVIVDAKGLRHSSLEDVRLTQKVVKSADGVLAAGKSSNLRIGSDEFFFEFVGLPVNLHIFGAGVEAVILSRLAHQLGWRVNVADYRPAFANKERFPDADGVACSDRENLVKTQKLSEESVAAVMTHNFGLDKQILGELLKTKIKYIGMMGPKKRTGLMIKELSESGVKVTEKDLARIHGPIGLDIGATTPEGIALSILAEIQSIVSGRTGRFLRERAGSIYDR